MARRTPTSTKGQLTPAEARMLGSEVRVALRQIHTELQHIIAKLDAVDAPLVDSLRGGRAGPKKVMVGASGDLNGHPPEKATLEPGGVVRLGDVRTRFL